jgi:tRNA-modifying protein YgfZ
MTSPFQDQILKSRGLIRLQGENVLGFLHNLLTTDVEKLTPGHLAYGALLSPQGKIQHEVFVHHHGEAIYIDCVMGQRETLLKRLIMYRLRAKIAIEPEDRLAVNVSHSEGLSCADPRNSNLGSRTLVAAYDEAFAGDDYHRYCMSLGIADGERDIGENQLFPHEANLDLLHGVSFTKGCYVGQEVVSRMQHRGTARTRILPVAFDGLAPPKDTEITSGDTRIGTMLSSLNNLGFALLRLDKLVETQAPLLTGSVRTHVRKPDWMSINFEVPDIAK